MSLATQTLDFNDDLGLSQLRGLAGGIPEFVKTASIALREEASKLENTSFALHALTKEGSRLRRFPVHTPADTWLSAAYFEKNAHKLPYQAARITASHIKAACQEFGLKTNSAVEQFGASEKPISNLYVEDADHKKIASPRTIEAKPRDGVYALPGRYPLFSEDHVKTASRYFGEFFKDFEPADRHNYAANVLGRAEALSVTLPDGELLQLRKVAGTVYGDQVERQLTLRREFAQHRPEALTNLNKIASVQDKATPDQFAALLEKWDGENEMPKVYGRYLLDPYQATYDTQIEKNAGFVFEDEQSGLTMTGPELSKVASEKYDKVKSYFGETLAGSLQKHGQSIFESLPLDAKLVIAQIAKGKL